MDQGPWANYYAVKLQQQQNQFSNNPNSVTNRSNGPTAIQQQQSSCYNHHLNNFNQNQMYTPNMESILAHYSNNEGCFNTFNTFNSHHRPNSYDAEFFQNQFQNAAKASLSAAALLKSSSKTKDNQHCAGNQLNANNFNNLNHDANFLSQHLPNWRHSNLHNMNDDVNNQQPKPFGVLPHQTTSHQSNSNGNVQTHPNKHHHNQYHNGADTNGHHHANRTHNGHTLNKMNQSNVGNLFMQNSAATANNQLNNQLNSSTINRHCNNFIENQATLHNNSMKANLNKNQLPHHHHTAAQADHHYLIAMRQEQQMLMKATINHHAQQFVNQQRATSNTGHHNGTSSSCVAARDASTTPSTTVNPHVNFQKNFINSQNVMNNNNLMNKTFNNTYCSMMVGGIQINNYNVSSHNNLIIANQPSSNCASSSSSSSSAGQQTAVNNFLMNNMNNLKSNTSNGISLLNGSTTMNNSNNLSNSRCSSVASVNNVQQINESSSCSYGNFSSNNSPSFAASANTNSPSNSNRNLSSSQQPQLNNNNNNVPISDFNLNYNLAANNSSSSFPHSNTPALSSTPGYPTPPSSVNRSEVMSQHSVQSTSQDEQLMQTHFNQNQFNGCNNFISTYDKLANQMNTSNGYQSAANQQLNTNLPDSNNSANCLPNLMNITPVSDSVSDNSKLNDSQCSTNALSMNHMSLHGSQQNSIQFGDESNLSAAAVAAEQQYQLEQQISFHSDNPNSNNQLIVQTTKKKKDKTKKKKKKAINTLTNCNLINDYYPAHNTPTHAAQSQYPVYATNGGHCASGGGGYFIEVQHQNQFHNDAHADQMNLQSNGVVVELIQQQHSDDHLNQLNAQQQQCLFENQNCQVNSQNQSLNDSNCSNEQMSLMTAHPQEPEMHLINAASAMEDKLDCLEEDLKYLTESNGCMLAEEDKELSEKAYTSDNSVHNSCSLDDSMMRHHQQQLINHQDQTSLNCSLNGSTLINGSISNSTNASPIDDLTSKHYEFEESNLDENYAYELDQEAIVLSEAARNSVHTFEERKGKKKKKKEKTKRKNGLIEDKSALTSKLSSSESSVQSNTLFNEANLLVKIHQADNQLSNAKKCKVERDEYEFTDEFAVDSGSTIEKPLQSTATTTGKKRKKINCENVNKKNKQSTMNSLNEELIKTFNSSKERKEEKYNTSKLKVLTAAKGTNHSSSEYLKKSGANSVEASSTTSSSSSTSFSLNSKKENQELIAGNKRSTSVHHTNGHHASGQQLANTNGAINSKSVVILNTNNQNVVQINNKKIITGKNITNQIESKKNEVSLLSKSDPPTAVKCEKKSTTNSTDASQQAKSSANGTSSSSTTTPATTTTKTSATTAKRRSSEKKALTIREGLMRTSDFVISKEALEKNLSLLWRIEGKSLLQLFTPVEENGSLFYQNTSSYSAWNPTLREKYVGVDVRIMGCNRNKITVEKLSINKSSGNGNIDEKLLNDAKDDLSSLFSPAQHSTNFAVYIQTLISQILDPHFIREIVEENDEYFINHIQKIDECCLSKKAKIYSKIKWETSIIKCIETYPKCEAIPQENSGDLRCKFCYEKWSTQILNFTGQMYDTITLEHIRNDELKLNKYAACDACKNKVMALSNLLHQKYHFYVKCGEKVSTRR